MLARKFALHVAARLDFSQPLGKQRVMPTQSHAVAALAIECDDVSQCSTTPKGVLDTAGKSGRSFLEFIEYLRRLGHSQRPAIIVVECVGNLHHLRRVKETHERGTAFVSEQFSTFGYEGSGKS